MPDRGQAKLTDEQRAFVVQSLACFDSPTTVAKAVKKEYGVDITAQAVEAYDPTKRAGDKLGKRWTQLFHATRDAFLKDTSRIGIAHRVVRMRTYQRVAEKAEEMGNLALLLQVNEQAAKEEGGAYTNRRELTGQGGKPLVPTQPGVVVVLPDNGRG